MCYHFGMPCDLMYQYTYIHVVSNNMGSIGSQLNFSQQLTCKPYLYIFNYRKQSVFSLTSLGMGLFRFRFFAEKMPNLEML